MYKQDFNSTHYCYDFDKPAGICWNYESPSYQRDHTKFFLNVGFTTVGVGATMATYKSGILGSISNEVVANLGGFVGRSFLSLDYATNLNLPGMVFLYVQSIKAPITSSIKVAYKHPGATTLLVATGAALYDYACNQEEYADSTFLALNRLASKILFPIKAVGYGVAISGIYYGQKLYSYLFPDAYVTSEDEHDEGPSEFDLAMAEYFEKIQAHQFNEADKIFGIQKKSKLISFDKVQPPKVNYKFNINNEVDLGRDSKDIIAHQVLQNHLRSEDSDDPIDIVRYLCGKRINLQKESEKGADVIFMLLQHTYGTKYLREFAKCTHRNKLPDSSKKDVYYKKLEAADLLEEEYQEFSDVLDHLLGINSELNPE
ncbi:MAG: hypothetical protein RLN62_05590 [Rickettsiales bacterium]